MNSFRVVIADDVADARFLARAKLEDSGLFEVVAEARDGEEAITLTSDLRPDILLLDLSMPRLDGVAALPAITTASPETKVVVFSSFSPSRMERVTRSRGAVGYIQKSLTHKNLVAQLVEVAGLLELVEDALLEAGVTLGATLRSAGAARRFVSETLERWQCGEVLDTVMLLVSELVTNAVIHAGSDVDLSVRLLADVVRVEVIDTSTVMPAPRDAADHETSGRGLAILDAMSSAWGVDPLPEGKRVWFEVPRLTAGSSV